MDTLSAIQNESSYMWNGPGDFCQEKWNKFIDVVGDNDLQVWFHGTAMTFLLPYWIGGALFSYMDVTLKPKSLRKYKIQKGINEPLDWTSFKRAVKLVLFNQIIVSAPCMYAFFRTMEARGLRPLREFPSFASIVIDIVVFLLIREISFYYGHRMLHHKWMYKLIHKKHHEWTTPIAITAVYCNPIEHVISNILPVFLGPIVMRSHVFTVWLFVIHITVDTIGHHSGYHLPFMASPEFHDFHHAKFNNNFGVNGLLDWLHGTDTSFRKSEAFKRHTFLVGLKSAHEVFPDAGTKRK